MKLKKTGIMLVTILMALLASMTAPARWYWNKCVLADQFKVVPTRAAMAINSTIPVDATITITQSASGSFNAAIDLLGTNGDALTNMAVVGFYFSTDVTGQVLAVTSTDLTSVAIGTDGMLMEDNVTGNVWGRAVCETDGDIDIDVVVPASKVVYLNLIMPDGTVVVSAAMTYGM